MTQIFSQYPLVQIALSLLAGGVLGIFHFASLRATSGYYLAGSVAKGIGLHVVRIILLVGIFFFLARLGAMPLLGGACGLLLGRWIILRRYRMRP